MLPEQVRDGKLPEEVGVENPQLGEDPVVAAVSWGPDGVVSGRLLAQLYRQRDEVSAGAYIEQH